MRYDEREGCDLQDTSSPAPAGAGDVALAVIGWSVSSVANAKISCRKVRHSSFAAGEYQGAAAQRAATIC
jgi:hypothetical protein